MRIVSLLAAGTEIVHALGLGESLTAISHECDYPPEVLNRPRITRTHIRQHASSGAIDSQVAEFVSGGRPLYTVDWDLLESLQPDLILTQSHCHVCAVNEEDILKAIGQRPALRGAKHVSLTAGDFEGQFQDILRVAAAAGAAERGVSLVAALRARVEEVQRTVSACVGHRPRVACIEWVEPVMVAANWMPELIERAGGQCGLTAGGRRSGYTDWKEVIKYDPEVVVVMPCGFELSRAQQEAAVLGALEGWQDLAAVRNGRVYAADGNAYFNRSGPRLVDSLELLALLIHPGLFADRRAKFAGAYAEFR